MENLSPKKCDCGNPAVSIRTKTVAVLQDVPGAPPKLTFQKKKMSLCEMCTAGHDEMVWEAKHS